MAAFEAKGAWALVTGASSGIGADMARELAGAGAKLILVARRADRLQALADELRPAEVVVCPCDLADDGARRALYEAQVSAGRQVDILVNNAGMGAYGDWKDMTWERESLLLQVDIVAVLHLTRLFGADMVKRGRGRILLVSSVAAYQPCPSYAAYGAAKTFIQSFGEALDFELGGTGVTCTVLAPGATKSEFFEVSGQQPTLLQRSTLAPSRYVAAVGIRRMLAGSRFAVPGVLNWLATVTSPMVPRRLSTYIAWRTMVEDQPKT